MGSSKFSEEENFLFLIEHLENRYNVVFKKRTGVGLPGDWQTYFHYVDYFKTTASIDEHQFYIATGFVYGWMPTMLKKINYNQDVEDILNKVLQRDKLDESNLVTLTKAVNNSLVGVSKLLHFIAPEKYPIWDSRVYFSLFRKQYYSKGNTNRLYLRYTQNCREIAEDPKYDNLHQKIMAYINSPHKEKITKIRTIELLLYLHGQERMKNTQRLRDV